MADGKKSVFVLDLSPEIKIGTAIGPVYLYGIGADDMADHGKRAQGQDALPNIRHLLSRIGSTEKTKDGRAPRLTESQVSSLTDDDIERLAEACLETMNNQYHAKKAAAAKEPVTRDQNESAVSFLDRLVAWQDKDHREQMQKLSDAVLGKSANAFAEVMKQSSSLSGVLKDFRNAQEVVKMHVFEMPSAPPLPDFSGLRRMEEHRQRERAEEMAHTRQISEVSAQSASLLVKLSDAATQYITQFAESSRKADEGMRKGLRIAIWSLVGSVVLTALGLVVAIAAYRQEADIHRSNEKWQSEMSHALKQQASFDSAFRELSSQNAALRRRVEVLEAKTVPRAATKARRNKASDSGGKI